MVDPAPWGCWIQIHRNEGSMGVMAGVRGGAGMGMVQGQLKRIQLAVPCHGPAGRLLPSDPGPPLPYTPCRALNPPEATHLATPTTLLPSGCSTAGRVLCVGGHLCPASAPCWPSIQPRNAAGDAGGMACATAASVPTCCALCHGHRAASGVVVLEQNSFCARKAECTRQEGPGGK